ncbi:MAG: bifunctional pyr operon transcriptional regulator/uracil phosphoribosyltransferase, partial [Acidobacteriota bacterium]
MKRNVIWDSDGIERALSRMAQEMVDREQDCSNLALIGIHRRGVPLAERLAARLKNLAKAKVPVGAL